MGRVEMNPGFKAEYAARFGPGWQDQTAPLVAAALTTTEPVLTGNMLLETDVTPFTDDVGRPALRARGKAHYTAYVDQGTGLYGPLAKWITPTTAKALSWIDQSSGKRVYAKRTRGQRGQHFFARAMRMVFNRVIEHPFGQQR